MPYNQFLVKKKVNERLENAKGDKFEGQSRTIETSGIKIEQL
jgi:hypothetical protein